MTGLARMLFMLLGVAAVLAPAASADAFRPGHGDRLAVTPLHARHVSGGELLGEGWAQALVMSGPERGGCNTLARNVVVPVWGEDSTATCTISTRVRVVTFFGSECDSTGPDPYYGGPTSEGQLACAIALDQEVEAIRVTVDGARPVEIARPRFELVSPQRALDMPADNYYGIPAGPLTFRAHSWAAMTRTLSRGRHTMTTEVIAPAWGEPFTFTAFLNVVGRGQSGEGVDR